MDTPILLLILPVVTAWILAVLLPALFILSAPILLAGLLKTRWLNKKEAATVCLNKVCRNDRTGERVLIFSGPGGVRFMKTKSPWPLREEAVVPDRPGLVFNQAHTPDPEKCEFSGKCPMAGDCRRHDPVEILYVAQPT